MFTRKKKILLTIVAILIACVYYYVKLPALNIHSKGFWGFIIVVSALIFAVSGLSAFRIGVGDNRQKPFSFDKSELFGWHFSGGNVGTCRNLSGRTDFVLYLCQCRQIP